MALVEEMRILQNPASHNIHKHPFPEKPRLVFKPKLPLPRSVIGQKPLWSLKSQIYARRYDIRHITSQEELLHIFVLGPSLFGKRRLLECAANRNLVLPPEKSICFAYNLKDILLQGVEVEINLWHVGNILESLSILKVSYQKYKTCFVLVYDINDFTSFNDALRWIPSLRCVLGDPVPIVLVGYEDYEDTLLSKLTPVSYLDGMKAKKDFGLKTYYEFSDATGSAVSELIYEAAHIALETKVTTPDSKLDESEEKLITYVPDPERKVID